MNLESLRDILEKNALLFLVVFAVSLIANTFEIIDFFRERRKRKEEIKEKNLEREQLKIYQFLFDKAEKSMKSRDELEELRKEITENENLLPQLEKRIEMLRLAAKREIAEQNISRTINDIRNSFADLNKLQELRVKLGDLPDLPETEKKVIDDMIFKEANKPYELPKSISYKALLLVLAILLLPSPVDQLLIVALLGMYLTTFFEVATYSNEYQIAHWVTKHYRAIGFISCLGAWFFLIQSLDTLLGRPIDLFITGAVEATARRASDGVEGPKFDFLFRYSYRLPELIIFLFASIVSAIHWNKIKKSIGIILKK